MALISGLIDGGGGLSARSLNVFRAALSESNSAAQNKVALEAAIAAAYAAGGGTVLMPSGEFNITGNIGLKGGVSIYGVLPDLAFYANCQDLWNVQTAGTRLIGSGIGSGALFVGQNDGTGNATPPFPDLTGQHGLGMIDIGYFGVQMFDTIIDTGSTDTNGLAYSNVSNIHAMNIHDWLFKFTNNQHVKVERFHAWNITRGVWINSDNQECAPGLTVFKDFYMLLRGLSAVGSYPTDPEGTTQSDYAQRYHFYITNNSGWNGVSSFQLDSIKIRDGQMQAYTNSGAMTDTINIKIEGQATNGRVVNNVDIRDTNFDGASNYCVWGNYTNNLNVEIKHYPAVLPTAGVYLRNSIRSRITSWNNNVTIDADGTCVPFFVEGVIKEYISGSRIGYGTHQITTGNCMLLGGGDTTKQGMVFNPSSSGSFGISRFNPVTGAFDKTTWPSVITKGTRAESGTSVTLGTDRSGVWHYTGAGAATWTLPTDPINGIEYVIVNRAGTGTITVTRGGTNTIGDFTATTYVVPATKGASVYLVFDDDSNNWDIIGKN